MPRRPEQKLLYVSDRLQRLPALTTLAATIFLVRCAASGPPLLVDPLLCIEPFTSAQCLANRVLIKYAQWLPLL